MPEPSAQVAVIAGLPAQPDSPGRARQMVMAAMRNRGYERRVVDDAALAVSELASNAVRHAASGFSLTLRVRASTLRVAVTDHQPLPDGVPAWSVSPDRLHGLGLIEAISTSWGVARTADGKVVWARLASSNA